MKNCIFFVCTLVPTILSFANLPSVDWVRTADNYLKDGSMLARDNADNVVSTGYIKNASIYTQKYDKFGNFLWERSSSSGIHSNYEKSSWVNTDAQNNVYITGYRYTISTQAPFEFPNAIVVLKYDPAGNLLWKFILPGSFGLTAPLSSSPLKFRSEIDANGNLYVGTSGTITGNSTSGFILVKLNPMGNMVWNRTHHFGAQHGFMSMRLKRNLVVLTGSSEVNNTNVSSVMFDTSGNERWSAATPEIGSGKDVELDDAGNSYILTWNPDEVSQTSDADVVVLRYSSTGSLVKRNKYDFGGSEFAIRICLTGTNELGIVSYYSSATNFFTDWLVIKINMNGALQWSNASVNKSPYDVFPAFVTGNNKGELFVTGTKPSGKDFPGYLAIGTTKYRTDGTTDWSAQYDSTASHGLALTLASDGSLYVLGLSFITVIHYFDHTGIGACGIVDTARVTNITRNSAVIEYAKNRNAFVYHIQYKASTSSKWITISTDRTRFRLTGLTPGTTFDYRIEDVCISRPSGYTSTRQFTTSGFGYCATGGLNSSADFIDLVWFGSIQSNTWDNNGYADFTYLTASAEPGETVSGYLSATFFGADTHNEFFGVWIDFNIDGDFNDAGERIIDTSTASVGLIPVSFVVAANAKTGTTRMRVSMRNLSAPSPCGSYAAGETEDYGFVIHAPLQNVAGYTEHIASNNLIHKNSLQIFPNPASGMVYIQHAFSATKPVQLKIYNSAGQLILIQALKNNTIDVSSLTKGTYLLQLAQDNKTEMAKLIILH